MNLVNLSKHNSPRNVFFIIPILLIAVWWISNTFEDQSFFFLGNKIPSPDKTQTLYIQTYSDDRSSYLVNENGKKSDGMVWPKDSFSASWADSSMLYAVGYKHDDRMHLYVMDLADYSTSNINVRVNDTILNTLHSNTDEYGFDVDLEQDVSIELMRWCEGSEDMLLSFMAIDTSGRTHTGYCLYKYRSNETSLIYVS